MRIMTSYIPTYYHAGMIKNELKCEICYMRLHKKCQNNISYCTGVPIREKEIPQKVIYNTYTVEPV